MDLDQNADSVLVEALQSLTVTNDDGETSDVLHNSTTDDQISGNNHGNIDNSNENATATSITTSVLNPIYIPTTSGNDTWELTWPIWHMLPHQERKEIAKQNGFSTIGEFEESVILSRALSDNMGQGQNNSQVNDGNNGAGVQPYSSDQLYELENRPENYGLPILAERSDLVVSENKLTGNDDVDDDVDDSDSSDDEESNYLAIMKKKKNEKPKTNSEIDETTNKSDEEIENGGFILLLPNELIIHFILPFLPIEQYATCALVSPHWKNFTRTETVYKQLCKRCYLQQSKRKTLHVHRFNHSYHTMLDTRFRVKTGCGFYVLKCTKIKKIQRDMWTEIPVGAILESTYYRYMNFFENGTLLYALTSKPPHEMIPVFLQMKEENSHSHPSISAVLGSYEIQKDRVTVNVEHPWHHVRLILRVLMDGCPGSPGRFWAMEFEKHWSSKSKDFDEYWSRDLVEYKIPDDPYFRFLRDWRL